MKTIEKGQLVSAIVWNLDSQLKVVGEVRSVKATVVDGHGYERDIDMDSLVAADTNAQRVYWMDRALNAERRLADQKQVKNAVETIQAFGERGNVS